MLEGADAGGDDEAGVGVAVGAVATCIGPESRASDGRTMGCPTLSLDWSVRSLMLASVWTSTMNLRATA